LAIVARRQALLERLAEAIARSGYVWPQVVAADLSERDAAGRAVTERDAP
jgi:short-subunit dehydrogenase